MLCAGLCRLLAVASLASHVVMAQSNCINTCTDSANVLTQLKSCSGCGNNDFKCFCQCPQYINALVSCVEQYCAGTDVTNTIFSFCANEGVTLSRSSTFLSPVTSSSAASTDTTSTGRGGVTNGFSTASSTGESASQTSNGVASRSESNTDTTLSTTTGSPSSSSFTSSASSALSAYLQSAIPPNVRSESSNACFVNSPYTYYSTPTWYSSLPTQVQSYYSSMNQGSTAACTLSPTQAAALAAQSHHGKSGLSAGAIAGIVIGSILAAILLAALLWFCLRRRRRQRRREAAAAASVDTRQLGPRTISPRPTGPQALAWNEKGDSNKQSAFAVAPVKPFIGGVTTGNHDQQNQPTRHTTTTTTRTIIRSRPRNTPIPGRPSHVTNTPPLSPSSSVPGAQTTAQSSIQRKPVAGNSP